jgi:hypothetical protein
MESLLTAQKQKKNSLYFPKDYSKAEMTFIIFCSFLCTFIMARLVVAGLFDGRLKVGGFLYIDNIHIHHLNYGIILLSIVGFSNITALGQGYKRLFAVLYGIGLGLIFDEFGMLLELQDVYYNALSYYAVIIIATLFALITSYQAYGERLKKRRASYVREIDVGTILFNEGDAAEEAFLILEGSIEIFIINNDKHQSLAQLEAGEIIGEMALFTDEVRSVSAKALTPLKLRPLTKQNLLFNLNEHPEISIRLITALAKRVIIANQHLNQIHSAK